MNTVNNFTGTTVTIHFVSPDLNDRQFIVGVVAEVISQGVLITHGPSMEITSFYPWHSIREMTHVATVYNDTKEVAGSVACDVVPIPEIGLLADGSS